jgi:hypothetical protein
MTHRTHPHQHGPSSPRARKHGGSQPSTGPNADALKQPPPAGSGRDTHSTQADGFSDMGGDGGMGGEAGGSGGRKGTTGRD